MDNRDRRKLALMDNRRDRILAKITANVNLDTQTGCWVWNGRDSGNGRGGGYPRMNLDGQTVAVHRVLYTHYFGYIPSKKQVDHKCKNRRCLNPEHLELVTHLQNQRRKSSPPRVEPGASRYARDLHGQIDLEDLLRSYDLGKAETPDEGERIPPEGGSTSA